MGKRIAPPGQLARRLATWGSAAGIVLLALPAASAAVDFKGDLLRHPFMSDAEKHRLKVGSRYDVGLYLQTLPPPRRLWTTDGLLPYYADGADATVGASVLPESLAGYDYVVVSPGQTLADPPPGLTLVHTDGDYRLYRVDQLYK